MTSKPKATTPPVAPFSPTARSPRPDAPQSEYSEYRPPLPYDAIARQNDKTDSQRGLAFDQAGEGLFYTPARALDLGKPEGSEGTQPAAGRRPRR